MDSPIKPIFLLADSQLLFWSQGEEAFIDRLQALIDEDTPKAAYIGASNGDNPEFFQLFCGAMEGMGSVECRLIPSEPSEEDLEFFDEASLILLAGGDVRQGWRTMKRNGIQQRIIERYYTGAVLIGVSSGAVQLGLHGFAAKASGRFRLFDTFKLVPLLIDVHAEPDWQRLHQTLPRADEATRGLGIPSGSGAVLYPDLTLEAIRRPLIELSREPEGDGHQSLIFPPESSDPDGLLESSPS